MNDVLTKPQEKQQDSLLSPKQDHLHDPLTQPAVEDEVASEVGDAEVAGGDPTTTETSGKSPTPPDGGGGPPEGPGKGGGGGGKPAPDSPTPDVPEGGGGGGSPLAPEDSGVPEGPPDSGIGGSSKDDTVTPEEPDGPDGVAGLGPPEAPSFETPKLELPALPSIKKGKRKRLEKKTGLSPEGHHARVEGRFNALGALAGNTFSALQGQSTAIGSGMDAWLDTRASEAASVAEQVSGATSARAEGSRIATKGLSGETRTLVDADCKVAEDVVKKLARAQLNRVEGRRKQYLDEVGKKRSERRSEGTGHHTTNKEDLKVKKGEVETHQREKASELKTTYGDSGTWKRRSINEEVRTLIDNTTGIAVDQVGNTTGQQSEIMALELKDLLLAVDNTLEDAQVDTTADAARQAILGIRKSALGRVKELGRGTLEQLGQAEQQALLNTDTIEGELLANILQLHLGVDQLVQVQKADLKAALASMAPGQAAALMGILRVGADALLGSQVDPTSRGGTGDTDSVLDSHDLASEKASPDPLPFQSELEASFGRDLSGLDVNLGQEEQLDSMGAEGASLGQAISLPDNPDKELVAHEVAHTLQSGGGLQPSGTAVGGSAEVEADSVARKAARGEPVEVSGRGAPGIQRRPKPKKASGGGLVRYDIVQPLLLQLEQEIGKAGQRQLEAMRTAASNAQSTVNGVLDGVFGDLSNADPIAQRSFEMLDVGLRRQITHMGQELRFQLDGTAGSIEDPAAQVVKSLGPSLVKMIAASDTIAAGYVEQQKVSWEGTVSNYRTVLFGQIDDGYPGTIQTQHDELQKTVPKDIQGRAKKIYEACNNWGTDEELLFKQFTKKPKLTMRKGMYLRKETPRYEGWTVDQWLHDDLSGSGLTSAYKYLNGDHSSGAYYAYDYATPWYSTHDELIEVTSKGLDQKDLEKLLLMDGWGDLSTRIEGRLDGYQKEAFKNLCDNNLEGMWAGYLKDGTDEARLNGDFDAVMAELKEVPEDLRDQVTIEFAKMTTDFETKMQEANSGDEEVDELTLAQGILVDDVTADREKQVYVHDGSGPEGHGGHYETQTLSFTTGENAVVDSFVKYGEGSAEYEAANIGLEKEKAEKEGVKYDPGTAWQSVGNASLKNLRNEDGSLMTPEQREEYYSERYAEVTAAYEMYFGEGKDPATDMASALKIPKAEADLLIQQIKGGCIDPQGALVQLAKSDYKLKDLDDVMAGMSHSTIEEIFAKNPTLEKKLLGDNEGRKLWDREIALFGIPETDRDHFELAKMRQDRARGGNTGIAAADTGGEMDVWYEKMVGLLAGRSMDEAFDADGKFIPLEGQDVSDLYDGAAANEHLYDAYLDQKEDEANFWKTAIMVAAAIVAAPFTGGASLVMVATTMAITLAATALTDVVNQVLLGDQYTTEQRGDLWVEGITNAVTGAFFQRLNIAGKLFPDKFAKGLLSTKEEVIAGALEGYGTGMISKTLEESFKSDGKGFWAGMKQGAIDGVPNALGMAGSKYVSRSLPSKWNDTKGGRILKEGIENVTGNVIKKPMQAGLDYVVHGKEVEWGAFLQDLAVSSFVEFVQGVGGGAMKESSFGQDMKTWDTDHGKDSDDRILGTLGGMFKGGYGGDDGGTPVVPVGHIDSDDGPVDNSKKTTKVSHDGSDDDGGKAVELKKPPTSFLETFNKGTFDELVALPGIGEVKAQKIIDERAGGPYKSITDASDRIHGVGTTVTDGLENLVATEKFAQIMEEPTIDGGAFKKDFDELRALPENKGLNDWDLMNKIVWGGGPSGTRYVNAGASIDQSKLGDMTRAIPLETVFDHMMTTDAKTMLKADYNIKTAEALAQAMADGTVAFDKGWISQESVLDTGIGWWTPLAEQNGVTAHDLEKSLALVEGKFSLGALRFTVKAESMGSFDFKKPTAADGMGFEEYVPNLLGGDFGMTAGGVSEAVHETIPFKKVDGVEFFPADGAKVDL